MPMGTFGLRRRSEALVKTNAALIALPDPEHSTLPTLRAKCREIYDRRDEVIGVLDVDTANACRRQATAIEQFVGNRDGRDDARRSARVLECAVGAALGDAKTGRPPKNLSHNKGSEQLSEFDRSVFRLIHRYRALWEPELQHRGMSRSQVLRMIQIRRQVEGETPEHPALITAADWRDWLDEQPDCDLLLTDPPYATDVENIQRFAQEWLPVALRHIRPTGRAYVCIGAYPHELTAYLTADHGGMTLAQVLVWTYRNTLGPAPAIDYKQNWQAILYFRGPDATRLNSPVMTEQFSVQDINAPDGRVGDRYHAWQKPDLLAERFIRHSTNPGDLVLDPFAGTGTFLLAASRLGRVGIGCDSDPDQVVVCVERGCVCG